MRSLCFLSRNVGGTHFPLGSYLNDWLDLVREEECGGQNNDFPPSEMSTSTSRD